MKKNKNCQSCGMPLSRDENGGGTEKNGQKSDFYCSHCYVNGEFVQANITVNEMKKLVEDKIVEFGMPRFLGKFFSRNVHKLKRWEKTH